MERKKKPRVKQNKEKPDDIDNQLELDEDQNLVNEEEDQNGLSDEESNIEEDALEYQERLKRTGVLYISYIPEGLTISIIRKKLEKYGVNRIYLVPESDKKNSFKEGWIEFHDKIMAKLCEYESNGKPIGGRKRENLSEEIWNLKYLHKFKWSHLIEKQREKNKVKQQRIKTEIAQAHRESNFILESFGQSKRKRKRDSIVNSGKPSEEIQEDKFRRKIKQNKPKSN